MKKVLCFGTFDILHQGHKEFFEDAKKQGNFLGVIVISDKTVYENKKHYPVNNQETRAKNLKQIKVIDEVIQVGDNLNSNLRLIKSFSPDVIAFGYDQKTEIENQIINYLNSRKLFPEIYHSKKICRRNSLKFIEGIIIFFQICFCPCHSAYPFFSSTLLPS